MNILPFKRAISPKEAVYLGRVPKNVAITEDCILELIHPNIAPPSPICWSKIYD